MTPAIESGKLSLVSAPTKMLVVVAHPDDELLFFGGLLLAHAALEPEIVCVTDGDFEGDGPARLAACERVCAELGAKLHCLGLPDDPSACLDLDAIVAALSRRYPSAPTRVFTHSPHGDYGHFNHMDVSLAVHRAFPGHPELYVVAAHLLPELRIELDASSFARKLELGRRHYRRQLRQAWPMMTNLASEGFVRLPAAEVEAVHAWMMEGEDIHPEQAPHYAGLVEIISRF